LRVLENDAAEFAGGTTLAFDTSSSATLTLYWALFAPSSQPGSCRRFMDSGTARPGNGAFPGLPLIRLPEGGAILHP
jgi:hypothetical protein